MLTVPAGLGSSFSYANSDMLSQGVTRQTRALTQMVWVLTTGAIIVVPIALLVDGLPHTTSQWHGFGWAALAGVLYVGAFYCLLRGLQVGDLGLVSALNALSGAYVAVAVILLGEAVTVLLAVGLALCVAGAILTSIEGHAKTTKGAPWALASGFLFACLMLCYAHAGGISWLSQAAVAQRVVSGRSAAGAPERRSRDAQGSAPEVRGSRRSRTWRGCDGHDRFRPGAAHRRGRNDDAVWHLRCAARLFRAA